MSRRLAALIEAALYFFARSERYRGARSERWGWRQCRRLKPHLLGALLGLTLAAASAADAPATNAAPSLQIARTAPALTAALKRAASLLTARQSGAAQAAYREILHVDPDSADAWVGLAVAAEQTLALREAAEHYRAALRLDPQNATAEIGLINLVGAADPWASESRLKELLAASPQLAAGHFALGNLYAGQKRWAEARRSYRQAHAADRGNADFLYNLAVSCEELHQPDAARRAYAAALASVARRPGGFDSAQVAERLALLRRASGRDE